MIFCSLSTILRPQNRNLRWRWIGDKGPYKQSCTCVTTAKCMNDLMVFKCDQFV